MDGVSDILLQFGVFEKYFKRLKVNEAVRLIEMRLL
jgi:hypothetical protein